jgi:hypothetical protein
VSKTAKKVSAYVNLVRKLTGANWGASAKTLRTASLPLVYSTAEYCDPVMWLNSLHSSKIDIQLNNTMRFISDAWTAAWSASLPVNSNLIVNPNVRPPSFDLRRHNWVLFRVTIIALLRWFFPIF